MGRGTQKLSKGRPRVTHGGYSFIATGKLPEHRLYLLRYLSACREGLVQDFGGEENLSTAQLILIDRSISKLGLIRCVEEHIKENSVIVRGELAPALKKSYLAYSNSLRLDLQAVGLEQRAPEQFPTVSLDEEKEEKVDRLMELMRKKAEVIIPDSEED